MGFTFGRVCLEGALSGKDKIGFQMDPIEIAVRRAKHEPGFHNQTHVAGFCSDRREGLALSEILDNCLL